MGTSGGRGAGAGAEGKSSWALQAMAVTLLPQIRSLLSYPPISYFLSLSALRKTVHDLELCLYLACDRWENLKTYETFLPQ